MFRACIHVDKTSELPCTPKAGQLKNHPRHTHHHVPCHHYVRSGTPEQLKLQNPSACAELCKGFGGPLTSYVQNLLRSADRQRDVWYEPHISCHNFKTHSACAELCTEFANVR